MFVSSVRNKLSRGRRFDVALPFANVSDPTGHRSLDYDVGTKGGLLV